VEPRIPGSFAPPPKLHKRQPGGQPWPKEKNGRDWPQDRWGRPMRPLWDYPLGVRAPGEAVAPGEPGSFSTADAINAYLKAEAVFANPMGIRRAASAAPDTRSNIVLTADEPDEENRGLLEEFLNPFEPVLVEQYSSVMRQVYTLDPTCEVLTRPSHAISQADVDAAYETLNSTIDKIASEIAGGHASGRKRDLEFEGLVNSTIRNPTESGVLSNGRSYYYSKPDGVVVIVNPGDADSGTAFPVSNWRAYKATLK
jgi:hypothetical protein